MLHYWHVFATSFIVPLVLILSISKANSFGYILENPDIFVNSSAIREVVVCRRETLKISILRAVQYTYQEWSEFFLAKFTPRFADWS